jgi:hypothetical protein
MSTPAWDVLLDELEPHFSPEWSRQVRSHGHQGWIRLIALVDAHHQLSSPLIVEKIAMTMADLAVQRESDQAGWTAIAESARDQRYELVARVVATADEVLPEDLVPLFHRSLTPGPPM